MGVRAGQVCSRLPAQAAQWGAGHLVNLGQRHGRGRVRGPGPAVCYTVFNATEGDANWLAYLVGQATGVLRRCSIGTGRG